MSRERKKPLYRKVNTRTHGVRHGHGGDYRHVRNTKVEKTAESEGVARGTMRGHLRHGLDYTPLYRFLLKNVGKDWNDIHRQAIARLDSEQPIWHIVARTLQERRRLVRVGDSSYYSGLFIDDQDRLAVVDPALSAADLAPGCHCCTHTFNGKPFGRPYAGLDPTFGLGESLWSVD